MDTNDDLKLPKFNWNRILICCALALGASFLVACISRSRTIIRLVEVMDVLVILVLLAGCFYAIVKKFAKQKK